MCLVHFPDLDAHFLLNSFEQLVEKTLLLAGADDSAQVDSVAVLNMHRHVTCVLDAVPLLGEDRVTVAVDSGELQFAGCQ